MDTPLLDYFDDSDYDSDEDYNNNNSPDKDNDHNIDDENYVIDNSIQDVMMADATVYKNRYERKSFYYFSLTRFTKLNLVESKSFLFM